MPKGLLVKEYHSLLFQSEDMFTISKIIRFPQNYLYFNVSCALKV